MSKSSARRRSASDRPAIQNGRKMYIGLVIAVIAAVVIVTLWMRPGSSVQVGGAGPSSAAAPTVPGEAREVYYEVVGSYPHDTQAFLQGLVWHNGYLYESTGLEGRSTLRKVELQTGKVVKEHKLADDLFGEGLARVDNRLVQLTWTTERGFVYDLETFRVLREFKYNTEGWGLTFDGTNLILSDGSNVLTFLDPQTYQPVRKLSITRNGRAVSQLNELEYIDGEIWANVWQQDFILRIDPKTGQVTSFLNMRGILPAQSRRGTEDVLNGIAYDPDQKRIFISGKLWPKLFEIKVKDQH
jgi:glutamine cyclotransferase